MKKNGIVRTSLLALLFIMFTLAVINVDVQKIGPEGSEVGFAFVNGPVHDALPVNDLFYKLTTFLGYLALLAVLGYGAVGVWQLMKRRSLKKVDSQLISLGIFFVLVIFCYVLFEKLVINYRPVILDEGLEASYPSSHTLLALCVFGAMMVPYPELFSEKQLSLVRTAAGTLAVISVVGRLLSGVHWLTDIVGAVLLSAALLSGYVSMLQIGRQKQNAKKT